MVEADNIRSACLELAQTMKWAKTPFDAAEITGLADRLSKNAHSMLSEALGIDPPLVERAIRYMHQVHSMPMGDNIEWFDYTLQALLEIARPSAGVNEENKAFLRDMLDGIQDSLADD